MVSSTEKSMHVEYTPRSIGEAALYVALALDQGRMDLPKAKGILTALNTAYKGMRIELEAAKLKTRDAALKLFNEVSQQQTVM
jgi:hypothetical protein